MTYIESKSAKPKSILFPIILVIFLLIGGLRYQVGSDWTSYMSLFNYAQVSTTSYINEVKTDCLFHYITAFIAKYMGGYSLYVFLIFFVSFFMKFYVIKKFSNNVSFSMLIYLSGLFIIFDINGIRQGLALSIIMLSLIFIYKRELLPFLLCILISFFIHTSSLIFLPFYFLSQIKLSNKQYALYSFILIALSITCSYLVITYVPGILEHLSDSYSNKMVYYGDSDIYGRNILLFDAASLRRILVWVIILYLTKKDRDPFILMLKNSYLISLVIFFLFSYSIEVAYRLSYYYSCFELILIPNILFNSYKNMSKINRNFRYFFYIFFFYLLYKIVSTPFSYLDAYNNILFS